MENDSGGERGFPPPDPGLLACQARQGVGDGKLPARHRRPGPPRPRRRSRRRPAPPRPPERAKVGGGPAESLPPGGGPPPPATAGGRLRASRRQRAAGRPKRVRGGPQRPPRLRPATKPLL